MPQWRMPGTERETRRTKWETRQNWDLVRRDLEQSGVDGWAWVRKNREDSEQRAFQHPKTSVFFSEEKLNEMLHGVLRRRVTTKGEYETLLGEVNSLLGSGAKADAKDRQGRTPLHLAAEYQSSPELVETLVKAGAKTGTRDRSGQTALEIAERGGVSDIIGVLRERAPVDSGPKELRVKSASAVARPRAREDAAARAPADEATAADAPAERGRGTTPLPVPVRVNAADAAAEGRAKDDSVARADAYDDPVQRKGRKAEPARRGLGFVGKLGMATVIVAVAFGVGVRALWSPDRPLPDPVGVPAQQLVAADQPEAIEASLGLGLGDVRLIQRGLAEMGYDPQERDGLMGRGTRGALRMWQTARGIQVSGYLSVTTAEVLRTVGVEAVREDSVAAVAEARAREDSVARARADAADAVLAAAEARAREDSVAPAREEAARVDERRVLSDFRELESELASLYSAMTSRYLERWTAIDWGSERPSVAFRGNRSVDNEVARSNQSAHDRMRQAGDRLRSDVLNPVSGSPSRQPQLPPSIEAAHREYQQKVAQHYNQLQALIGRVPGKVGALLIDVNPPDARVYINDIPYGTASDFANEPGKLIPSGATIRIRLERSGYRTHEETVFIGPYERHFIRGDMPRGPITTTASPPAGWQVTRNTMESRDAAKRRVK